MSRVGFHTCPCVEDMEVLPRQDHHVGYPNENGFDLVISCTLISSPLIHSSNKIDSG